MVKFEMSVPQHDIKLVGIVQEEDRHAFLYG